MYKLIGIKTGFKTGAIFVPMTDEERKNCPMGRVNPNANTVKCIHDYYLQDINYSDGAYNHHMLEALMKDNKNFERI